MFRSSALLIRKFFNLQRVVCVFKSRESNRVGVLHWKFFDHLKQKHPENAINSEFPSIIRSFENHSTTSRDRIKQIDNEYLDVMNKNAREFRNLLNSMVETYQGHFINFKAFEIAIMRLISEFETNPNQLDFVKLCFYIGQYKKVPPGPGLMLSIFKKHLDNMIDENLGSIDFAIICAAAYKAGVKSLNQKFIQRLKSEVVDNETLEELMFVTFIKSLRMNRVHSYQVIEKIQALSQSKNLENISTESLVHILAFMTGNNMKDDQTIEVFVKRFLELMNINTRAKDIQKLLYSCALLNCQLRHEDIQKLEKLVLGRTEHQEYLKKFDNFVDIALSLWILNYRSYALFTKLLNDPRFKPSNNKSRIKLESRKRLLTTCAEIEKPNWADFKENRSFDSSRIAPKYLIKPSLKEQHMKICRMIKCRSSFVQQIRNLNIAGILVKQPNCLDVHYEVLDESNCLSDKISPNGIFALKLRLLNEMGCKVQLVNMMSIHSTALEN